jgi:hypothetical protein
VLRQGLEPARRHGVSFHPAATAPSSSRADLWVLTDVSVVRSRSWQGCCGRRIHRRNRIVLVREQVRRLRGQVGAADPIGDGYGRQSQAVELRNRGRCRTRALPTPAIVETAVRVHAVPARRASVRAVEVVVSSRRRSVDRATGARVERVQTVVRVDRRAPGTIGELEVEPPVVVPPGDQAGAHVQLG